MTNINLSDNLTDNNERPSARVSNVVPISAKDIKFSTGVTKRADAPFWRKFGFDIFPVAPDKIAYDGDPQTHFDRHPDHAIGCTVPKGVVAYGEAEGGKGLRSVAEEFSVPPLLILRCAGKILYVYRTDEDGFKVAPSTLPDGVTVLQAGDLLPLPSNGDFTGTAYKAKSIAELSFLPAPKVAPEVENTALSKFSLRGRSAEFAENAVAPVAVLGPTVMMGQATLWYAPSNAGKTLLCMKATSDAVEAGRVSGGNVYYINADDSSEGFATKAQILDDLGCHTLCPGFEGFEAENLGGLLCDMAKSGKARGTIVIVDTLKKFTDLMDKKRSSEFAKACRAYVMAGGTVLGLAHTNKNKSATGKLVHAGTSDLRDDFDAAYMLEPRKKPSGKEALVIFEAIKRRGGGVEKVTYAYGCEDEMSYLEQLVSVREAHDGEEEEFVSPVRRQHQWHRFEVVI